MWELGVVVFSEFLGTISDMANDVQERMQALWEAADEAFRADPAYSIAMAEASSVARTKQQARDLVLAKAVGV